jgi:hypothetical protein
MKHLREKCFSVEIQTEHLPGTSLQRHRFTSQLGNIPKC